MLLIVNAVQRLHPNGALPWDVLQMGQHVQIHAVQQGRFVRPIKFALILPWNYAATQPRPVDLVHAAEQMRNAMPNSRYAFRIIIIYMTIQQEDPADMYTVIGMNIVQMRPQQEIEFV
jgi:hypothetical protein